MDENLHDIDDLFRNSLEGHEEMPPENVWNAIDKSLDKSSVVAIRKKYNHLKKLAAVLAVVLSASISWSIYNHITARKENLAIENKKLANTGVDAAGNITTRVKSNAATNTSNSNNDSIARLNKINEQQKILREQKQNATAKSIVSSRQETANKKAVTVNHNSEQKGKSLLENKQNQPANFPASVAKKDRKVNIKISTEKNVYASASGNSNNTNHPNEIISEHADNNGNEALGLNTNGASAVETSNGFRLRAFEPLAVAKERIVVKPGFYNGKLVPENNPNNLIASSPFVHRKRRLPRFSIMPFYGLHFSSNNVREEHHHGMLPPPDHDRDEIRNAEHQRQSFSYGIMVNVALKNKWLVQSGVAYIERNTAIEPKLVFARPDEQGDIKYRFECSLGYGFLSPKSGAAPANGDSTRAGEASGKLGYINVPLAVNYSIPAGKFRFIPALGGGLNLLVKQKLETEIYTGSIKALASVNKIQGLKSSYFSGFAGLGVEYALTEKIGINLTPAASFGLGSINKNAAVKSYSSSFSLSTGLRVTF
jgi:hypothetical protein